MSSITIVRYQSHDASRWDALVEGARNATFLLRRAYMDYHADRFADHSLLFFDERHNLIALLPANESGCDFHSHQGLTYGGFIVADRVRAVDVMQLFTLTVEYLREHGFERFHYKPVPTIYHRLPSQEDEYALWRLGASQEVCNLSSTALLHDGLQAEYCRRRQARLCGQQHFTVQSDAPLSSFWPILTANLRARFDAAPVHTLAEMQHLQEQFPDQIRCYLVLSPSGEALGGTVVYECGAVAHTQYSSATAEGRRAGALDFLYMTLLDQYARRGSFRYFDFGTSNEERGRVLNEGLIHQKEGFGARGVVYRTYLITL